VVSYLHRKGIKFPAIITELAAVYHEDAFDENRVKYWLHEIELHRSDLSDRPLEDIDARILQVLEAGLWPSVQTIAEFLKISVSTMHLHLTTSFNMKTDISNGFPIFLTMV
jgi:DNA-binding NarL/FixJ family response regulator